MTEHDRIIEQAAAWHVASSGDAMDWDGFTAWLEADPRHRTVYDEISLTDAAIVEHRGVLADVATQPQVVLARSRPRLAWAGGAIAAVLVAMVAVPQFLRDPATVFATDGASRQIAFADGTHIVLAPHSRLEARDRNTRLALDGGAWFAVRHDPSRRMEITAGPVTISDIGTEFDVQTSGATVRVAVADGRVSASAAALDRPLVVTTGQALAFDRQAGTATLRRVARSTVGSWRSAQLSFTDAPLSLVVADLERYAGVHVAIQKNLRSRRFSGTLNIRDGAAAARDLAGLMGLALRRVGSGYRLEPVGG